MYKLLFFLHKTDDEDVLQFFKDNTVKKLEEIIGETLVLPKLRAICCWNKSIPCIVRYQQHPKMKWMG